LLTKYNQEFFSFFKGQEINIESTSLEQLLKAFQYLNNVFQLHKSFASVLELSGFPILVKENGIENHKIMENVIDKFKVSILNTAQFRKVLFVFLKYIIQVIHNQRS